MCLFLVLRERFSYFRDSAERIYVQCGGGPLLERSCARASSLVCRSPRAIKRSDISHCVQYALPHYGALARFTCSDKFCYTIKINRLEVSMASSIATVCLLMSSLFSTGE